MLCINFNNVVIGFGLGLDIVLGLDLGLGLGLVRKPIAKEFQKNK